MTDPVRFRAIVQISRDRPRNHTFSRFAIFGLLAVSLAVPVFSAGPQDKKAEAQLRTVHGSVVDKDENPVGSSIVYLLNVRTQSIITRITDDTGTYRFSGLDPNVDYEIHAEHDDLSSPTRTVSSFDSRRDIELILKLSHKKAAQ
jgi:Carboxypeptidase regulatory-like domain